MTTTTARTWGATLDSTDADAALEQLYADHWRALVRLSVLLVRDVQTAEECVQDAFVATFMSGHGRRGRLRDPDKTVAYLRQAVVNRSRDALRHRKVVDRHLRSVRLTDEPSSEGPALAHARRDTVLAALAELPHRQREVLALRHYLELSEAEIADALGISKGAVKSHASRGSATLRALLSDSLEDLR